MKALADRLEILRAMILDDATGITDPDARQDALDVIIEAGAIADAIPDLRIALPSRSHRHRRPAAKPAWDAVVNGGSTR